jgi:signal transduction histidine kinase
VKLNFLFLIAVMACPLWVLELTLELLGAVPPRWVGDSMAVALILMGSTLLAGFFKSLKSRKGPPRTTEGASIDSDSLSRVASVGILNEWEQSLPCLFHEIRNYSSTLRGNALLLRRHAQSDSLLEPLGRLERTTAKIECLARDILDASSITQATRSQSLDLKSLIQGCILDHFPDSRETFRVVADPILPAVEGDALKLERVFLNLFRNAREAGAKSIQVRLSGHATRFRILIEDDGQGCSREQLGKLFRPMYTTKKEQGGTGLGLYMVKAILESHGGSVRAVSKNLWSGSRTGMIFCLEMKRTKNPMKRVGLQASRTNTRLGKTV